MSTPTVKAQQGPRKALVFGALVLWLSLYFGVRFYLEGNPDMAASTRLWLALVPAPFFAVFLLQFIRAVRNADELERRIQLEALAVAFPLGLLLLTTLGLVQRAVEMDVEDWSYNHVWPMFVLFYVVGLAGARRHYR